MKTLISEFRLYLAEKAMITINKISSNHVQITVVEPERDRIIKHQKLSFETDADFKQRVVNTVVSETWKLMNN